MLLLRIDISARLTPVEFFHNIGEKEGALARVVSVSCFSPCKGDRSEEWSLAHGALQPYLCLDIIVALSPDLLSDLSSCGHSEISLKLISVNENAQVPLRDTNDGLLLREIPLRLLKEMAFSGTQSF